MSTAITCPAGSATTVYSVALGSAQRAYLFAYGGVDSAGNEMSGQFQICSDLLTNAENYQYGGDSDCVFTTLIEDGNLVWKATTTTNAWTVYYALLGSMPGSNSYTTCTHGTGTTIYTVDPAGDGALHLIYHMYETSVGAERGGELLLCWDDSAGTVSSVREDYAGFGDSYSDGDFSAVMSAPSGMLTVTLTPTKYDWQVAVDTVVALNA